MILHIDMDAFFASVEQRDNPNLRNKPIVISGKSKRSVVSTASYEARKFGIHSAMPVFQAKQKCKNLIIVSGNMKKYQSASKQIMKILSRFSPIVEQVSIDEAYMDISGCQRLFGSLEQLAYAIKKDIYNTLSLTCSIGIAPVKFISKIASDINKPDGITIIEQSRLENFITNLPIQKVPGIGKNAMKSMAMLQIKTLGDIQRFDLNILQKKFGKMGGRLIELANGIDSSHVSLNRERKSISSETTLTEDLANLKTIKSVLLDRSHTVGRQLRNKDLVCKNVNIKLKFSDFSQITRSKKLDTTICSSLAIYKEALSLYQKVKLKKKIRLIGVGVSSLKDKNTPVQLSLISNDDKQKKQWESVDKVVDSISEKFGNHFVIKASQKKKGQRRKPDDK